MAEPIAGPQRLRWWWLLTILVVPLMGLALLLARPELDVAWEHHPSHFWLVLGTSLGILRMGSDSA